MNGVCGGEGRINPDCFNFQPKVLWQPKSVSQSEQKEHCPPRIQNVIVSISPLFICRWVMLTLSLST